MKQEVIYDDNIEIISTGEDSMRPAASGSEIVRLPESTQVASPFQAPAKVKDFNPSGNKWYKVCFLEIFITE